METRNICFYHIFLFPESKLLFEDLLISCVYLISVASSRIHDEKETLTQTNK